MRSAGEVEELGEMQEGLGCVKDSSQWQEVLVHNLLSGTS